jgi:2-polyprenyl-3-methyl-5-hydroxy-6-metoxy-1,4-benzoquinol methylase
MKCIICQSDEERRKFRYQNVDFYECKICGLVRTWPFPSEAAIEMHYRNKFKQGNYTTLLYNMPDYVDVYRSYTDLIKRKNGSLKGKLILDVGCFTGDFLDLAQRESAIGYGIELQQEAFEIAERKHPGRILNCPFEKASFHVKFDIITLFGVVEHVTNPDELIGMASEWLVRGGKLVIQTPNTGSYFAKIMRRYWPPYTPVEHIHYFSKRNIQQLLENYHFGKVDIRPHVKRLTLNYIFAMLSNFGPEFQVVFRPIMKILPNWLKKTRFPSYVGEMIIVAEKIK